MEKFTTCYSPKGERIEIKPIDSNMDCEICGKRCIVVFYMKRFEKVYNPIHKREFEFIVSDAFGHEECLLKCAKK